MISFRKIRADEIEIREGSSVGADKYKALLYMDARAATDILDDSVGASNWQFNAKQVGEYVMGSLGIYDTEKKEWIWKDEIGKESNIESDKGLISDIKKRCLAGWGVNELYKTPEIILSKSVKAKYLHVSEFETDERRVCTKLTVVNDYNQIIFSYTQGQTMTPTSSYDTPTSPSNIQPMESICENPQDKIAVLLQQLEEGAKQLMTVDPFLKNNPVFQKWGSYYRKTITEGNYKYHTFKAQESWAKWMERENKRAVS